MRTQAIRAVNPPQDATYVLRPILAPDRAFNLTEFLSIGRDESCQLQLRDDFASQRHARIERKPDGRYLLRDLRSTNGTFVNGIRILESFIQPGDRLTFGSSEYIFSLAEDSTPLVLRSKNAAWAEILNQLPRFAQTTFPVLLLGPSGTGKELLARSIHSHSDRANGPFLSVNCSALSESLVESELFGHVRGSFTGASQDRRGAFEAARGGSLFLDEIGDLPLNLQPKLLRALENGEIRPVGSDRTLQTDVRIIAATHQNLSDKVASGGFRADLYFRLNVIRVETPALRHRLEDLEDLVLDMCRTLRVRVSHQTILALKGYQWPGNIRELKNMLARAAACFPGQEILPSHLPRLLDMNPISMPRSQRVPQGLREMEVEMIRRALERHNGNQRRAASELGIPKSTLHDKVKALGLQVSPTIDPLEDAQTALDSRTTL